VRAVQSKSLITVVVATAVLTVCLLLSAGAGADAPPQVSVSPSSINLSDLGSITQQVTITNTGGSAVQNLDWGLVGDYPGNFLFDESTCIGISELAPGASCTYDMLWRQLDFSLVGTWTPTFEVTSNAPTVSIPMTLTWAPAPSLTVSPATIAFGDVAAGQTSAPTTVTVTNGGPGAATMNTPTVTNDGTSRFAVVKDECAGKQLVSGGSCTFRVTASSLQVGQLSGVVSVSAPGSTTSVNLSASATLPPASAPSPPVAPPSPPVAPPSPPVVSPSPPVVSPSPPLASPPAVVPEGITQIATSSQTVRWCAGCAYPKTTLQLELTNAASVRVPLQVRAHGRWRQTAVTTFHGRAGLNRYLITDRWRGQLVPARTVELLVQLRHDSSWQTQKTLRLTVRSPFSTGILHESQAQLWAKVRAVLAGD